MSTSIQQADPPAANEPESSLTPEGILALGLGFWGSKALLSAVELGIFSELAGGPLAGEELAARVGLDGRSWRDFLDALVALGMLDREDGTYTNTAETALFLDRSKPSYIGGMLEMANARLYPFWGSLTEALISGRPQNEAKRGGDFFPELYRDPLRLKQFLHAMTGLSLGAHKAIAAKFPWQRYRTFADVGCAEGGLPVELALAHGHLTGTGFDLAPCAPHFDEHVRAFGLQDRLRFHPGDFFADPVPTADVLVLGHILHDWSLEQKQALLAKAHASLPQNGALIVFEAIIDDQRQRNTFGLLMSLNMLIETPAGFDYTAADCRQWMQNAGFRDTYVEPLVGPDSMVVGIK
jgi:hypothetical protein